MKFGDNLHTITAPDYEKQTTIHPLLTEMLEAGFGLHCVPTPHYDEDDGVVFEWQVLVVDEDKAEHDVMRSACGPSLQRCLIDIEQELFNDWIQVQAQAHENIPF